MPAVASGCEHAHHVHPFEDLAGAEKPALVGDVRGDPFIEVGLPAGPARHRGRSDVACGFLANVSFVFAHDAQRKQPGQPWQRGRSNSWCRAYESASKTL